MQILLFKHLSKYLYDLHPCFNEIEIKTGYLYE